MKGIRAKKGVARGFIDVLGQQRLGSLVNRVVMQGKTLIDGVVVELGTMLVESLMIMERAAIAGPDYRPISAEFCKGGSQMGSVYVGQTKIPVRHPRVRGPDGEIELKTYAALREKGRFSEELLTRSLGGLAMRNYAETLTGVGDALGLSPATLSRRLVEATSAKLKEFQERDLSSFDAFTIFLDTIHRGGRAFIVALGIDRQGEKLALGFWEGATENADICQALLSSLESRGLRLHPFIIFVVDGGKGVISALRNKFGKKLLLQRCTIHKSRNIQRHLAKRYRAEAARRFRDAIDCTQYGDAKRELLELIDWLEQINASAAESVREALEDLLLIHRLKVPELLRQTLHSTNPIESMFSIVRRRERNIQRFRGSPMRQRWLAAVLLNAEKNFRRIKGSADIAKVILLIESGVGHYAAAA